MDFDLSEEQRLLKESVDGLLERVLRFRSTQEIRGKKRRLEQKPVGQVCRTGFAGSAVQRRGWRFWCRRHRNHDCDGSFRQCSVLEPYLATVFSVADLFAMEVQPHRNQPTFRRSSMGRKRWRLRSLKKIPAMILQMLRRPPKKRFGLGDRW